MMILGASNRPSRSSRKAPAKIKLRTQAPREPIGKARERRYSTGDQRRQTGWIGARPDALILDRTLDRLLLAVEYRRQLPQCAAIDIALEVDDFPCRMPIINPLPMIKFSVRGAIEAQRILGRYQAQ